jgi:hypothetical protein
MPNWKEVLDEIQECPYRNQLDHVRRKYLKELHGLTGRNLICYYSGFLQKPGLGNTTISDDDKNGFMAAIHTLDRTKGLDLVLHTPGGDLAATESIVDYIRKMFGNDIRAIVPQIAMSAGTMIACSCKSILMGKQSSLGPIDPQFGGIPAHGVLSEFNRAIEETKKDPSTIPIWQTIVSKYHPTFIGECQNAIDWAAEMATEWLSINMLVDNAASRDVAALIVSKLSDHDGTKTHARHIPVEELKDIGLRIEELEKNQQLQDLVLTVHHTYMHTFSIAGCAKIIENQVGTAIVSSCPS